MDSGAGGTDKPGKKRWGPLIAAAALLLLLAIAAWWWLHQRELQLQEAGGQQRARLQSALERQRALEGELEHAKPVEPTECPPGEVLRPVAAGNTVLPAASAPIPGTALPEVPTGGEAAALTSGQLADKLEHGVAIVIVAGENNSGFGTGFFITPNLLVTNRHVVEKSAGKGLFITSKTLGSLRRATVLHMTRGSEAGTPDLALLRMDDGQAMGLLTLSPAVPKLAPVVAAGYPGLVVEGDAGFQRLLRGDLSSAPDLNLTQGGVQSLQTGEGGMPMVVHTALISQGNSGGPLVDQCGRVVGVNTFFRSDPKQAGKNVQFAIGTKVVTQFLSAVMQSVKPDERPCAARG